MYDIEINGTSYPVKFGMNFIREMNQRVTVSMDAWGGKEENVGLNYYIARLFDGDLEALQQILFVANKTETPKLNISMLNDWFEDEKPDKLLPVHGCGHESDRILQFKRHGVQHAAYIRTVGGESVGVLCERINSA